jgi:hypothetical protein
LAKRSSGFERRAQDYYPTPAKAVLPLLPHLLPRTRFVEPCAGDGALIRALEAAGHICVHASDIELRAPNIVLDDAATCNLHEGSVAVTNPPWAWDMLHPIIENLSAQLPTWLLLDADFMHNVRAARFMRQCRKIVSIGRVQWIADSKQFGKSNSCWMLFEATPGPTLFYERAGGALPALFPIERN